MRPAIKQTASDLSTIRKTMKKLNSKILNNSSDEKLTDDKMLKILYEYDEQSSKRSKRKQKKVKSKGSDGTNIHRNSTSTSASESVMKFPSSKSVASQKSTSKRSASRQKEESYRNVSQNSKMSSSESSKSSKSISKRRSRKNHSSNISLQSTPEFDNHNRIANPYQRLDDYIDTYSSEQHDSSSRNVHSHDNTSVSTKRSMKSVQSAPVVKSMSRAKQKGMSWGMDEALAEKYGLTEDQIDNKVLDQSSELIKKISHYVSSSDTRHQRIQRPSSTKSQNAVSKSSVSLSGLSPKSTLSHDAYESSKSKYSKAYESRRDFHSKHYHTEPGLLNRISNQSEVQRTGKLNSVSHESKTKISEMALLQQRLLSLQKSDGESSSFSSHNHKSQLRMGKINRHTSTETGRGSPYQVNKASLCDQRLSPYTKADDCTAKDHQHKKIHQPKNYQSNTEEGSPRIKYTSQLQQQSNIREPDQESSNSSKRIHTVTHSTSTGLENHNLSSTLSKDEVEKVLRGKDKRVTLATNGIGYHGESSQNHFEVMSTSSSRNRRDHNISDVKDGPFKRSQDRSEGQGSYSCGSFNSSVDSLATRGTSMSYKSEQADGKRTAFGTNGITNRYRKSPEVQSSASRRSSNTPVYSYAKSSKKIRETNEQANDEKTAFDTVGYANRYRKSPTSSISKEDHSSSNNDVGAMHLSDTKRPQHHLDVQSSDSSRTFNSSVYSLSRSSKTVSHTSEQADDEKTVFGTNSDTNLSRKKSDSRPMLTIDTETQKRKQTAKNVYASPLGNSRRNRLSRSPSTSSDRSLSSSRSSSSRSSSSSVKSISTNRSAISNRTSRVSYRKQLQSILEAPEEDLSTEPSQHMSKQPSLSSTEPKKSPRRSAEQYRDVIEAYRKKWNDSRQKSVSWKHLKDVMSVSNSLSEKSSDHNGIDPLEYESPPCTNTSKQPKLTPYKSPDPEPECFHIGDEIKRHLANSPSGKGQLQLVDDTSTRSKSQYSNETDETMKSSNVSCSTRPTLEIPTTPSSPYISKCSHKMHSADEAGGIMSMSKPQSPQSPNSLSQMDTDNEIHSQRRRTLRKQASTSSDKLSVLIDKLHNTGRAKTPQHFFPENGTPSRRQLIMAYRRKSTDQGRKNIATSLKSMQSLLHATAVVSDRRRDSNSSIDDARTDASILSMPSHGMSITSPRSAQGSVVGSVSGHSTTSDPTGLVYGKPKSRSKFLKGILKRRLSARKVNEVSPSDASSVGGSSRISWKLPVSDDKKHTSRNELRSLKDVSGSSHVFDDGQFKLWGGFYVLN